MQCGAKCFVVEIERDGQRTSLPVVARTSVLARKAVRLQYDDELKIVSVRAQKKGE